MTMRHELVLKTASSYVERVYEERRAYPRVVVEQQVEVWTRSGARATATLHDISPDAVQIRCDRQTAANLHPSGRYVTTDTAPEVFLEMRLPGPCASTADLVMRCRMTYFSIRDDGSVVFGLVFEARRAGIDRVIEQFIAGALAPRSEPPSLDGIEVVEDCVEDVDDTVWDLAVAS